MDSKLAEKRDRYMQDPMPVRLGGLAANLARVKSFAKNQANRDAVYGLFDESKYFIEWTAAEAEIDTAAELIELQILIATWQQNWNEKWESTGFKDEIVAASVHWSRRILDRSGLI